MKIPVFLSISSPWNEAQEIFLKKFRTQLSKRGFEPRTLGVSDYDVQAPLAGCRRLMMECNGLITLAFRRNEIKTGISRPGKNDDLDGKWLTSAFCQIEPAMAYQLGLPILIFTEDGVLEQGVLERGCLGLYMPKFDLSSKNIDHYFRTVEYNDLMDKWGQNVRTVWDRKGKIDLY